jgi:hypothetical protein
MAKAQSIDGKAIPSFHKGDLVRPADRVAVGWRDSTSAENEAWYEQFHDAVASGRQFLNSAGETPLPPRYKSFDINNSTVGIVTRARVALPRWARPAGGACEVFWPELGQTLIVPKARLERVD